MKKSVIAALYLLWVMLFVQTVSAQFPGKIQALKIGDTLPEFILKDVSGLTKKDSTFRLSNFKGKLVILDFWSTGCPGCIKAFPKMDSLQRRFNRDIQIVLVTTNSKELVSSRFAKLKRKPWFPALPSVIGDTILPALFPHISVPLHVWIDRDGIVRQITNGYNTTAAAIEATLAGKELIMQIKDDWMSPIPYEPRFSKRAKESARYYSYCSLTDLDYYRFVSNWQTDSVTHKHVGVDLEGHSIANLYMIAQKEDIRSREYWHRNRLAIEIPDAESYVRPNDMSQFDEWKSKNGFGYHLKVPVEKSGELFSIMRKELEIIFGIRATLEKRLTPCWVLVRKPGSKLPVSAKGDILVFDEDAGTHLEPRVKIRNSSISHLARSIAYSNGNGPRPVIDGTGTNILLDMDLYCRLNEIGKLKLELAKYGFDLVDRDEIIEIFVLREIK